MNTLIHFRRQSPGGGLSFLFLQGFHQQRPHHCCFHLQSAITAIPSRSANKEGSRIHNSIFFNQQQSTFICTSCTGTPNLQQQPQLSLSATSESSSQELRTTPPVMNTKKKKNLNTNRYSMTTTGVTDAGAQNKVKSNASKLKKAERELIAKVKLEELERLGKETSLNKILVAYLEVSIFTGDLYKAFNAFNFYRSRDGKSTKLTEIAPYNIMLHGFAGKGYLKKVREVFQFIIDDGLKPTPQSFAAILECLGRTPYSVTNENNIHETIIALEKWGFTLTDIFSKSVFTSDQREIILTAIRRYDPSFEAELQRPNIGYICPLLKHLNTFDKSQKFVSPAESLLSLEQLMEKAKSQFKVELEGSVTVKSIEKCDDSETSSHYKNVLAETEKKWVKAIEEALNHNFNVLMNQTRRQKFQQSVRLYPFLKLLPFSDYTKILLQEIRKLAEGSETYSPSVSQLYRELGNQVLSRFEILYKKETGILEKVDEMYRSYIRWYINPTNGPSRALNSRQKWQGLLYDRRNAGPDVDVAERVWPVGVVSSIGKFLYAIIMRDIKINANVMKPTTDVEQIVPAFYSIFRMHGSHLKEEIKPHPALVKLSHAGSRDTLTFESTMVPMISPPLPWASIRTGGYLLSAAKIVRLPFQAHQQKCRLQECQPEDLFPALDSLNQLGCVPWKINKKVLDVVIEVFNNKGDDSLAIPPPTSECPIAPPVEPGMTKQEKFAIHKQRLILKRKKAEMFSLWCDALYKLSLANHYKDEIFWFPHNMDFRGRVYPCPPHLNHLGSDAARAILVFAKGEPLGPNGFDWLKIHAVNLTGLKKREPISERLKFANIMMDEILDSADFPLTGGKWWKNSEEPWQTLACCIEIANAFRSGDPSKYISHFPVHQDGSCNGLQHYAALGRDQAGAVSVNLVPCEIPQDVYNSVAVLVERLRARDAENGVKIAQVLEGFIKRKVIKQTVMTTVYGVTRYGARLQIAKQLKDIPSFPKEHLWPASLYLVGRTFDSLREMFTSTKLIQDWFTDCAKLISQVCSQNVEWITPLGLPVVQPYFRPNKEVTDSYDPTRLKETGIFDMFEKPNVMKQKNAFPPNYIHSLDSSHMMLTSLNCERANITYVSVHDCFWTHAKTVEIMNKVCREQFVALHSEPILEDLSQFLVNKYGYSVSASDEIGGNSLIQATKNELNRTLKAVPSKGEFDLNSVLNSTYFFS